MRVAWAGHRVCGKAEEMGGKGLGCVPKGGWTWVGRECLPYGHRERKGKEKFGWRGVECPAAGEVQRGAHHSSKSTVKLGIWLSDPAVKEGMTFGVSRFVFFFATLCPDPAPAVPFSALP